MAEAPKRRLPVLGAGPPTGPRSGGAPQAEAPKRRLPVLQGGHEEGGDEVEDRPPWHWLGFGTVATFAAWLPLAIGANALVRRMALAVDGVEAPPEVRIAMVSLNAGAFGLAAMGGGFLVGRFGGRAGVREAMGSGALAGVIAWVLALGQGAPAGLLGWVMLLGVMVMLGGSAGYGGGRLGMRRRGTRAAGSAE